jgi:glycosyltransferase involved in cell wall biosynthesis
MRIAHCCLASFYIDNYGYQENILPKVHKEQGHEVLIIASTETYLKGNELEYVVPSSYHNEHGIPVVRLPYSSWLPFPLMKKIRSYKGVWDSLEEFGPDIIFLHDIQFFDVITVRRYCRKYTNVKVFADGHTDFINSARNWISKNVLHKIIYKSYAKIIEPYVETFFGVTPLRVDFFREVYGIKPEKLDLLVLGVDMPNLNDTTREIIRRDIRSKHEISEDCFVIISGGKLDKRKNMDSLIRTVNELVKQHRNRKIKMFLFGRASSDNKEVVELATESAGCIYLDWLTPDEISQYLIASDLACFPGTHSVIWEQSVGLGVPGVFRQWHGMEHVDVGGNCRLIPGASFEELYYELNEIIISEEKYNSLLKSARSKGQEIFSYRNIAKKAIGLLK